jgi:putative drug exporter of the RND superfamily
MRVLARIVTGRRIKWVVLLAWVLLLVGLAPLGQKLADVTDNRTESFLPPNAESTAALRIQEQRFAGGETVSGLVVYRRADGLTPADQDAIAADSARAAKALPLVGKPSDPVLAPGGKVAYVAVALPDDNDKIAGWGKDLRAAVRSGNRDGLELYVTGGVGFNADFEEVFGSLDVKVLGVTVVLVVVLLLLIYRSPLIALVPLVVVGFAYSIAQGFVYLYAKSGATVSDNGATILVGR